jgi:dTDP-4-dehydrorhamnose reductase
VYPLHFNSNIEPVPWEIYGELKLESEKVFASNFSNLTIFRPGTLVEVSRKSSMMNFILQLMRSRIALVPGDGNMVHPFTYTHDLVGAITRWVKDPSLPNGTFDLTSKKPITFNQISHLSRGSKPFLKLKLPEAVLSHIGSDRFPLNSISRWHFRGLFYNYHQQSINVYQETFKEYKDIFTS